MATRAVEDYLKCILLEEQKGAASRVATGTLASTLGLSPGTVTAMLRTLAQNELVDYEAYSGVLLTESGRRLATEVVRRHRLLELFLVRVLGFDWSEVHDEAERLEHAVSERLVERIDEMLGRPAADPHGDPIPTADGAINVASSQALENCPVEIWYRVARISDQGPPFLRWVEELGLAPGARVRVRSRDEAADTLDLELSDHRNRSIGLRAAAKIFVS